MSWENAEEECQKIGLHLISLTSKADEAVLERLYTEDVWKNVVTTLGDLLYVGLTYDTVNGAFNKKYPANLACTREISV